MADVETLGILEEIQVLVSVKLQVVSYKWLSRNFSVSSNDAKRLLQEFVEEHGSGLEVIYTLSGYLKDSPQIYHISLVSGLKLAEVKQKFGDSCSVQVYSVQACIPSDPAALWNSEFVQAEELFDQPSTVENCLRDNRFCGVSNSFVKRNASGDPGSVAPQPSKTGLGVTASSKTAGAFPAGVVPQPQPQKGRVQQPSPKLGLQASTVVSTDDKTGKNAPVVHAELGKPHTDKATTVPADKKKLQNEKTSSGAGGSLANLWGRASSKSKPSCPSAETATVTNPIVTADAQISAREALDAASSDDDGQYSRKRESNGEISRKRRVVFDFSDDEDDNENVVSLASPDLPKRQPVLDSTDETKNLAVEEKKLNFEEKKGEKLEIKKQKTTDSDSRARLKVDSEAASKNINTRISSPEKIQSHILEGLEDQHKKNQASDAAHTSPKRKKVLRTRIDERGREVTEVVWEGDAAENKNTEKNAAANGVENRPSASNKGPALGSTAPSNTAGKAGNKKMAKGTGKDSKQGNILSFFKKV